MPEMKTVLVEQVLPPAWNPRGDLDLRSESMEELTGSVKEHGIITPLLVRQADPVQGKARYQVIAGSRR